jgi:hypothetical protein
MSESSEARQPIVVNITVPGAYTPPQVESAARLPMEIVCRCSATAGAGAGGHCLCGSGSGAGR